MKYLFFKFSLIICLLLPFTNWSQNVHGKIVNNENFPLEFAYVSIINTKDSLVIDATSTNKLGEFKFSSLKTISSANELKTSELTENNKKESKLNERVSKIEYMFQVHLVGYKKYKKPIYLDDNTLNVGVITLENQNLLEEVVLTVVLPFSIKKDTVSYNTQAFKVKMDDTVEDLLKKLPGIEIDVSGIITAQGEVVNKIYVDGKEFFHGDPTLIIKNLSAYGIKRVEVIDEKSEKARITGINDSSRKKIINLELKDDKKVNDFGKFHGGYGTDDRYLTSLNYNRFSTKLQASIIGKYNNVNSSGSDISDIISFNTSDNMSSRSRPGFLTTGIAGLNLGYEINEDQSINADYFYNYTLASSGNTLKKRTELIGDDEINSVIKSSSENISHNNNLNFSFNNSSNKLSSMYINGSLYNDNNQRNSNSTLDRYNAENELNLESESNTNSESENNSMNLSFQYTKRFNEKSKRNFSISSNFDVYESTDISNNNQVNNFNIASPDNAYKILEDTNRDEEHQNLNLGLNLNYVEPLGKNNYLEVQSNTIYVTIKDNVNQVKHENDILQQPLIYNQYYTENNFEGGVFYKYDNDEIMIYLGGLFANQNQIFGLTNEKEYTNSYTNFNPQMTIMYRPKRGETLNLNLKKSILLPSLTQLTPVINDFNSLYIQQGNPFLTSEETISVSGMYNSYNFNNGFNFFSHISYSHISNSIVNSEFTDQLGIRSSTYENFGEKNSIIGGVKLAKRIKSLGLRYKISIDGRYSDYLSIINSEPNETQSKNGALGLSLENNKKDKIDAIIGTTWSKNYTNFSNGNNTDRDFFQQSYFAKIDWYIIERLNLNSQFKYDIYADSFFGANQSVPIWNATVSYSLLKSKNLNMMLTALDILNKNIGIMRTSTDNYFEEIQQEVLGNYYLLSLTYRFK